MGPDAQFILTLLFLVVVIPVVIGVGSSMFNRWLRYKEHAAGLLADKTAEKAAQYAAQVERLEQRMRVLERIATDRGSDLAVQIEDLRNPDMSEERVQ